jgi:23S rRNA (guanosine2251-2'-O)-methyltransferase
MSNKNASSMWIYGKHAVKHALRSSNREILRIVILESCADFVKECSNLSLKPEIVDKKFFLSVFGGNATHQGCAVFVKKHRELSIEELANDPLDFRPLMFLDQITDPQNIGSIMRAAAVFGARAVVVTDRNSPELTPAIAKAASGSIEYIPFIRVTNLVSTINNLKKNGFWCVGLDERSDKKIQDISLDGKFIFIIGSEGNGMRKLTRETCDFLVTLPSRGKFSTLNAAQAATITLYEVLRQQGEKK